jgi:hypothetical protein
MKVRKPIAVLATAAASLALIMGGAAPANAASALGSIQCPSNMVAKVSFITSTKAGVVQWYSSYPNAPLGQNSWGAGKARYHAVYAPRNGTIYWSLPRGGTSATPAVTNIYATCVF